MSFTKVWREGAEVERAHTVPHVGEYSVGKHSHAVAMLLIELKPNVSANLLKAAILHDLHEVHTGDVPSFAKTPDFRHKEAVISTAIGADIDLTDEERDWLHSADVLELLFWCRDQLALGNSQVLRIQGNVTKWFMDNEAWIPQEIIKAAADYKAGRTLPIGATE